MKDTARVAICVLWAAYALAVPHARSAQAQSAEFRGMVRDSASGAPIAGAVVLALNAAGQSVQRTIAGSTGIYRMNWEGDAVQIRAVRLGFRPSVAPVATLVNNQSIVDLLMTAVPRTMEAMDVVAARGCPVRADRAEAFGLLDQARAGLLATVVARERAPATLTVLRFDRLLDLDGLEIVSQQVHVDSSSSATTSFNASRSALDFVERGFRSGTNGRYMFYGPDADVLLDERFQRGYCFSLAANDTARPTLVGLRFAPANRRAGRVDIDGTIWIDTTSRTLSDIRFRYLGVEMLAESFGAGGTVGFRTLSTGIPFIDRWSFRLVGAPDTSDTERSGSVQRYAIREIGGELAEARWDNGDRWQAPLTTLLLTAVDENGHRAPAAVLRLADTDYRVTTDATGHATLRNVLPGPYHVVVDDPRLRSVGLEIPTFRQLVAQRASSMLVTVEIPSTQMYMASMCQRSGASPGVRIIARAMLPDGTPVAGAKWRLSESVDGRWRVVSDGGFTGSDGFLNVCRGVELAALVELAVWRDPSDAVRHRFTLQDSVVALPVTMPVLAGMVASQHATGKTTSEDGSRTSVRAPETVAADTSSLLVAGSVRDSVTNRPVPNARVTFLGTPFEGASDSTGQFIVSGLGAGAYLVEVSTPWLDSIGAVRRTNITVTDPVEPLTLFTPARAAVMAATCGGAGTHGAVVGRITSLWPGALHPSLRVIAEWSRAHSERPAGDTTVTSTVAAATWAETSVQPEGLYRLCGVPVNQPLTLRVESDSGQVMGAAPRLVTVDSSRSIARADLDVDTLHSALPSFSGVVIVDSTGTPLEGADVTLMDLGRTTLTNARGTFRLRDIPIGQHLVRIKRLGFVPVTATIDFPGGRAVHERILLKRGVALATMDVRGTGAPVDFDERRRVGLGKYLSADDLARFPGRNLGSLLAQVPGFGTPQGSNGKAWVVGKRAPIHILPRSKSLTPEDLEAQGFYCPTGGDRTHGILQCACFVQVFVDGVLMNPGSPTEPFDVNALLVDELAGLEFYATSASTPGTYSGLNARCGVMLAWTRRRR